MKIISADASPFARKVRITILELGLENIEVVNPGAVTPASNNQTLNDANPLGMLPVLVLDDSSSIVDSPVICEYLNHQAGGKLCPDGENRFAVKSLHALADGLLDVAVALRYETGLRPEQLRWSDWMNSQVEKINRTLDHFESISATELDGEINIATITVGCALGYLDFRYPHIDWRTSRPALDSWNKVMQARSSFTATIPA